MRRGGNISALVELILSDGEESPVISLVISERRGK